MKLEEEVAGLRAGDTARARAILKQLSWLVFVFSKSMKVRHGLVYDTKELRRDIKESIVESAVLCPEPPEVWARMPRPVMQDIDRRISSRVKPITDFRKKVSLGWENHEFIAPKEMDSNLIMLMSEYQPKEDIEVLQMKADGRTFRSIAKELHVSCSRVVIRFRRCTNRLRGV